MDTLLRTLLSGEPFGCRIPSFQTYAGGGIQKMSFCKLIRRVLPSFPDFCRCRHSQGDNAQPHGCLRPIPVQQPREAVPVHAASSPPLPCGDVTLGIALCRMNEGIGRLFADWFVEEAD